MNEENSERDKFLKKLKDKGYLDIETMTVNMPLTVFEKIMYSLVDKVEKGKNIFGLEEYYHDDVCWIFEKYPDDIEIELRTFDEYFDRMLGKWLIQQYGTLKCPTCRKDHTSYTFPCSECLDKMHEAVMKQIEQERDERNES